MNMVKKTSSSKLDLVNMIKDDLNNIKSYNMKVKALYENVSSHLVLFTDIPDLEDSNCLHHTEQKINAILELIVLVKKDLVSVVTQTEQITKESDMLINFLNLKDRNEMGGEDLKYPFGKCDEEKNKLNSVIDENIMGHISEENTGLDSLSLQGSTFDIEEDNNIISNNPVAYDNTTIDKSTSFNPSNDIIKKEDTSNEIKNEFPCNECGKILSSDVLLVIHKGRHADNKCHKCPKSGCKMNFVTKRSLKEHLRNHHDNDYIVSENVISKEALYTVDEIHVTIEMKNDNVDCKLEPKESPTLICDICFKSFPNNEDLEVHVRIQHKQTSFRCKQCEKEFASRKHLLHHKKTHATNDNTDFMDELSCDVCQKVFFSNKLLKEHAAIHHMTQGRSQTGDKPYKCLEPYCGKLFHKKKLCKDHYKNVHSGERFHCNQCEKSFSAKSTLEKHKAIHSSKKQYSCSDCGREYYMLRSLQQHIKVHHNDTQPLSCEVCDKTFFLRNSLTTHMRKHTGDRPYQCEECGQTFYKHSTLKRHLKLHSGENMHCCQLCDKKFPWISEFKVHMKKHAGEKAFQCEECGNSFYQSSHLRDHMMTHRGPSLKCEVCGKGFTRNYSLRNHMKKHTGIGLATCKLCSKVFIKKQHLLRHIKSAHGLDSIPEGSSEINKTNLPTSEHTDFQIQGGVIMTENIESQVLLPPNVVLSDSGNVIMMQQEGTAIVSEGTIVAANQVVINQQYIPKVIKAGTQNEIIYIPVEYQF